jgi:hypothetical protein
MYSLNGLHSNPTSAMFPLDTDLTIEFKPHENRAGDGSGLILDYEIIPGLFLLLVLGSFETFRDFIKTKILRISKIFFQFLK